MVATIILTREVLGLKELDTLTHEFKQYRKKYKNVTAEVSIYLKNGANHSFISTTPITRIDNLYVKLHLSPEKLPCYSVMYTFYIMP